ncbi:MAG: outer membrane protein assembly factor BamA [Crocinitomicaceae bacterium]|nr:outer membrane protein assembly factor BamA [Crocinitomicaceae bacterium]
MKQILPLILLLICAISSNAQIRLSGSRNNDIDYSNPKKYTIGGIIVVGTLNYDPNAIILISGLSVNDEITVPGPEVGKAIKNLWDQGMFADIDIRVQRIQGSNIFLEIVVEEQPRLSKYNFLGVSKSEAEDLREKINLYREKVVTKNLIVATKQKVRSHFVDKGFFNVETEVIQKDDEEVPNHVILTIRVRKNKKVRIKEINITGNEQITDSRLKRAMKETKEKSRFHPYEDIDILLKNSAKAVFQRNTDTLTDLWREFFPERFKFRVFKSSKFINSNYEDDKKNLIALYNSKGYRDAEITSDSVYDLNKKRLQIDINIDEGNRYYFRNIEWIGNSKYSTAFLDQILGIDKGDIYDPELLNSRLFMSMDGRDVSSLYMDDGYLFFQVNPIEKQVEGDSIDLELRIYKGQQARVRKVIITGNTKTNEHVIRREIRTRPGDLFNRSDIIRTQQELNLLGYFDPQAMNVIPKPNQADGTVDIEYHVEERPNDQIELSGGFGSGRIVGTLGVSFNNFSTRNFFKKEAWRPLPSGDGQRLSIRAQTNGIYYQSYNISFTEPWLGGKRPNALSVTTYYSIQSNGYARGNENRQSIDIFGVTLGLGRRLSWPDDHFQLYQELTWQNYNVNQWTTFENFSQGHANNIYYKLVFSRSSVNDANFPTSGSTNSLTMQLTPPYSLLDGKDYTEMSYREQYKLLEYNKWKFTSSWYKALAGKKNKLVLYTKVGFGTISRYTTRTSKVPFERFYLGGSGLTGYSLDGREIIALRGYDDQSVDPVGTSGTNTGGTIINKYTTELRYPISLNPQAMVYALTFVEAGNTWNSFTDYNPFSLKRSAGVGVRIFLPMFGLLGLDWGYRFDDINGDDTMQRSQIHFTIGANIGQL